METNRIMEILDNFKNKNILIIGDIMLDKYIYGDVDRISPEAPVQVVNVKKEKYVLGGAANVASNVASLGCKTSICGVIGKDEAGKILISCLEEKKINRDMVVTDKLKISTQKIRIVGQSQQLLRIDYENTIYISPAVEEEIIKKLMEKISLYDVIIISDYAKGTITNYITATIIKNNNKVIVDPKPKHKEFYKGAYLITPNLKEASAMSGIEGEDENSISSIGQHLLEEMNSHILITCGARGMYLFKKDREFYRLPTKAKEVYDVTGAGDTVIATIASSLSSGATLREASYIANYAAGIVVGKSGTASTAVEEIKNEIKYDKSRFS
ncbi:MAG TPA: D-glycero-beta-D-manno-heptose-7-phosphate kinase [Candidatus Eremiobacteraeota bacterium]|nr:MAG: Bifunctional protein HldE [bacterium ADurb.Bin363]HPZ07141.1 D-glycero-beta-D-manno-heptose-7-phosphate kinase [Candidatus Eremiobacteraeota bacterium]